MAQSHGLVPPVLALRTSSLDGVAGKVGDLRVDHQRISGHRLQGQVGHFDEVGQGRGNLVVDHGLVSQIAIIERNVSGSNGP